MADENTAMSDEEVVVYWTHPSRADMIGVFDWIESRQKFDAGEIDIFIPVNGHFCAYRLNNPTNEQRTNVREATRRLRKRTFERSMA